VIEVIGALFWTFHVIVLGKFASKFEAMSFSVGQLLVCGALNLGSGFLLETLPPFNWNLMIAIFYTAFLSLGLCYTLQVWAQRHSPPSDAALILSLESVFAVLSGWLFLNEILNGVQIIGCVLIFGGVLFSQIKEWTSSRKAEVDYMVEGH
jgi:drug/metabolite transporter (DMT)-like permease